MVYLEKLPSVAIGSDPARGAAGQGRAGLSRRELLRHSGMLAAAAALADWPALLGEPRAGASAYANHGPDLVSDTFHGLAAFIVPGPDAYSVHQGVTDTQPGGVAACTAPFLAATLDLVALAPPPLTFSQLVAGILNQVAQGVYFQIHQAAGPAGPFDAPFANLSFADKAASFAAMESGAIDPALVPLAGALPIFAAFIAYSEAGFLVPQFCTLNGQPVGWVTSGYDGPADGRADFLGYF